MNFSGCPIISAITFFENPFLSQAKPSQAKPSQAKPSRKPPSSLKTFLLFVFFCLGQSRLCHHFINCEYLCRKFKWWESVTTSGISTTGATLIVVAVSYFTTAGVATPSDSQNNTWTALNTYNSLSAAHSIVMYYANSPTTGSNQTFTESDGTNYPGICVLAFSGTNTSSPVDSPQNGEGYSATTMQTRSIRPNFNNEVLITGVGAGQYTYSINDPTIPSSGQIKYNVNNDGVAIAYLIQTTALTKTRHGLMEVMPTNILLILLHLRQPLPLLIV